MNLSGKRIVIAGAGSAIGLATARELRRREAGVVAIARDGERLEQAMSGLGVTCLSADLRDASSVREVGAEVASGGSVDGVFHVVGGWRGGGGIPGQSLEDWELLSGNIVDSLRLVSQEFYSSLLESPAGRIATISATAVDTPTASNANYASAKSAAETWMQALAQGFHAAQAGAKAPAGDPDFVAGAQRAASVRFVVKALLTEEMRAAEPERAFTGYTEVETLAHSFANLFEGAASELNGARISLVPGSAGTVS